jgi:hypothetical protein
MKLRDLKQSQIDKLQKRCTKEYTAHMDNSKPVYVEELWKQAWSNGLKAGLEFVKDV